MHVVIAYSTDGKGHWIFVRGAWDGDHFHRSRRFQGEDPNRSQSLSVEGFSAYLINNVLDDQGG